MHPISLSRRLGIHLYPFPTVECVAILPARITIPVMWKLGRDASHVPGGLKYPRAG